MKLFSRPRLPKVIASAALVAIAIALPLAATAADMVSFSATTGVANMTAGDTTYASSVNAKYNEVVKAQVIYDNNEAPSSTKVATNVHVKFTVPTTPGVTQTITTRTSADNVTTVNGSASVKLDGSDAYLQYIPGTAVWKHAASANGPMTVEQKISDDVVTSANGVNLGNENPCQAGSVTIQIGVMVPGVSVHKYVRAIGATNWVTSMDAKAGDTVQYLIAYKNIGNTNENNVVVRDNLPPNTKLVPGTTYLRNSVYSTGLGKLSSSDAVTGNGINITDYAPGGAAYVTFNVTMPGADKLTCGNNTFRNVGVVDWNGGEYFNTADVNINKTCVATPTYSCDVFDVTADNASKTVTVSNFKQSTSNGATFKNAVISWGDNSSALTTNTVVGQSHSYAANGTYVLTATAHFTVNGQDVTAPTTKCTRTVAFSSTQPPVITTPSTPAPVALVNTGPGEVVGLFAAVSVLGAFAHRMFLARRLTQN